MRKFLFLLCLVPLSAVAQFDDQFYRPEREWKPTELSAYERMWIVSGADSLVLDGGMRSFTDMALVFAPEEHSRDVFAVATEPEKVVEFLKTI